MRRALAVSLLLMLLGFPLRAATALDQDGRAQSWRGPSDQYTIIDFAASWCRPCWKVLPRLQEFADNHPSVRVIVVSVDEDGSKRDQMVEKLGLTIPVVWDDGHEIAEHYRPEGMPATFVLDPDGRIIHRQVGSSDQEWSALVGLIERVTH